MRPPEAGRPDPDPPCRRSLHYALICRLVHQPGLIRCVAAVLRRWPALGGARVVARRDAVDQVLTRPASFTNASHATNLVAGDFLIGRESGPAHAADRAVLDGAFDLVADGLRSRADAAAGERVARLMSARAPFDLIEDYLMWVALRALIRGFGDAAPVVVAGTGATDAEADPPLALRYMHEVRHVAAHLFGGAEAPMAIVRRAEASAAALRARVRAALPELRAAWPHARGASDEAIERNAVGLAWVSHPVTVQAGALIVRELLRRPFVYAELHGRVEKRGSSAWHDAELRADIRAHVLELMRFRPVFPALSRAVPRPAICPSGAYREPRCKAGGALAAMSLGAMFDTRVNPSLEQFDPQRDWGSDEALRWWMFGHGPRQCPAMSQAVVVLESALLGLLRLPRLCWADALGRRIRYDGPMVSRMRLRLR